MRDAALMANPNIAKLKKKAGDFEQKKQFDRALSLYIQLLEEAGRDLDDADLQLFNRVGDLLQRQGNVSEALAYYEKAVDVYAERGVLNNAIALCNKVLRQSPGRTSVYYKLGKISATKGFKSDAKKNFLEYADRMQKSGHIDEACRALKEFAELCPDQDDIRLMLAEWLTKENRPSEAVEQLQTLYSKLEAEGRSAEARATIDRIQAIDPSATPRQSGGWVTQKASGLVFLDLNAEETPNVRPFSPPVDEAKLDTAPTPTAVPRVAALEGLILTFNPDDEVAERPSQAAAIHGFEATSPSSDATDEVAPEGIAGLEQAYDTPVAVEAIVESVLTVDSQAFAAPSEPIPLVAGLESPRVSLSGAHPSMSALIDEPPMSGREFADLELEDDSVLSAPDDGPRSTHDLALPSDLPLLPATESTIDLLRVLATRTGAHVVCRSRRLGRLPDERRLLDHADE